MTRSAARSLIPSRSLRDYLAYVLLVPSLFLALHVALNLDFYRSRHVEFGDEATYGLQTERARTFSEALGPYSRFGFNHPGPVSFYYYAATEPLLAFIPTPLGRHYVAQFLLNAAFLLVALHTVYRLSPRKSDALLLFSCVLFVLAGSSLEGDYLSKIWPPYLLVFPTLTFLVTIAAVAAGHTRFVLPATIASIVILQNHVAGLSYVVPFWAVAALLCWLRRAGRQGGATRVDVLAIILAGVTVVAAFAPPLLEQLTPPDGNLSRIWRFFTTASGGHTWRAAIRHVAAYFGAPLSFARVGADIVLPAVLVGALLAVRRGDRYGNTLVGALLLGVGLAVVAATRIVGPLFSYIQLYVVAFVALGVFLTLRAAGGSRNAVVWPLVVAVGAVSLVGYRPRPATDPSTIMEALVDAIKPRPGRTYELFLRRGGPHHERWAMAAGMALLMTRRGVAVCFPAEWEVEVGRAMSSCPGGPRQERVAFYETSRHDTRVRELYVSADETTIEFGAMRLLDLPVTVWGDGPDDYFVGWSLASGGFRSLEKPLGEIVIPVRASSKGRPSRGVLQVRGRSDHPVRVRITLNGNEVAAVEADGTVEETLRFDPALLRPGQKNVVGFAETGPPASQAPATPSHFRLLSVTLDLE